jgi:hypothetical protein|nr:MAG TPA: hypothetical protein [Caudoviricetes sp.]
MTKTNYEYAVIFSEEDVKHDFISYIATVIEDCDEAIILVRSSNYKRIVQVAEITCSYERGNGPEWRISVNEETAGQLGIDEIPNELLSVAMLLKQQMSIPIDFSTAFEAARLISDNFKVSHK